MEISQEYIIAILGVLLAVSELIALNPKYKSNSVLQLVQNIIKAILGKKDVKPEKIIEDAVRDEVLEKIIDEIKKDK